MLKSYPEFEVQFMAMLKVRSRNYVNTDCDITALINSVYTDISNNIILGYTRTYHTIGYEETFTVESSNIVDTDITTITEYYDEATDILDDEDLPIGNVLTLIGKNEYRWKSIEYRNEHIDDVITFLRPTITEFGSLPIDMYDKLFTAILEGVIYHIQTSIPSQVDGQVSNLSYQRFFNEKKKLLNLFPQIIAIDKDIPKEGNRYEY